MLKGVARALGPSKDAAPSPPGSPAAGSSPTGVQARRVEAEHLTVPGAAGAAAAPAAGLPPRPPASPFDAPVAGLVAGAAAAPGSPPRLGRASMASYLSRDEVQAAMAPELQHRVRCRLGVGGGVMISMEA